jgi:hypothetical protein
VTKIGLYNIVKSTTLESNKSLSGLHVSIWSPPQRLSSFLVAGGTSLASRGEVTSPHGGGAG